MGRLNIIEHPLVQNKIAMLRDKNTGNKEFREIVKEIATLLCYEATRDLPMTDISVETPLGSAQAKTLGTKLGLVTILREGLGMTDGILNLIPNANVGHIGLYRDPATLLPVEYFCKLPTNASRLEILLVDPMLATGGNACAAIQYMKERNVTKIKFLCIMAAPEGVKKMQTEHPDVDIFAAAYDTRLDENGYIFPGLGDAGNRLFGTK